MKAKLVYAIVSGSFTMVLAQSPFTPGNLVVLQVGSGSGALSSAGAPVYIDEFSPSLPNTQVQQISIPSDFSAGITLSGSASSEGALTLSPNGTTLTFAGYRTNAGLASVATSTAWRAAGVIDAQGNFTVGATTVGTSAYAGNNVRSAVSAGGNLWMGGTGSGANSGVWVSSAGGTPSLIANANVRNVNIFNGNLFYSSGASTTLGIYQFIGLPTGAATASALFTISTTGASPYDFALSPDGNTAYVADDGSSTSRGIGKWVNNSGTWSLAYTLSVGGSVGARQMTVNWGTTPAIFATTSETVSNRLVEVVDNGSLATETLTVLDTASANTLYRGVDFAPIPEPATVALAAAGLALLRRGRRGRA